jgi:hypothetical protein
MARGTAPDGRQRHPTRPIRLTRRSCTTARPQRTSAVPALPAANGDRGDRMDGAFAAVPGKAPSVPGGDPARPGDARTASMAQTSGVDAASPDPRSRPPSSPPRGPAGPAPIDPGRPHARPTSQAFPGPHVRAAPEPAFAIPRWRSGREEHHGSGEPRRRDGVWPDPCGQYRSCRNQSRRPTGLGDLRPPAEPSRWTTPGHRRGERAPNPHQAPPAMDRRHRPRGNGAHGQRRSAPPDRDRGVVLPADAPR